MEEFWQQGDEDRKLGKPVDLMYDRELANDMPVGQIGHKVPLNHYDTMIDFAENGVVLKGPLVRSLVHSAALRSLARSLRHAPLRYARSAHTLARFARSAKSFAHSWECLIP